MNFKYFSKEEISAIIEGLGQKPYRADQIISWMYKKLASSFDEMTDQPRDFREKLKQTAYISSPEILKCQTSKDGTRKYLFELEDGETIESVLIPNALGSDCFTLCISSQAGCAMNCGFCATGMLGFKRNLKAYEIYDQILTVKKHLSSFPQISASSVTNIVFMGMGEPFNNMKEVIKALHVITGPMEFSRRRVTVSTSGVVPGFQKLGEHGNGVNLAVSLNATTDDTRSLIMPVNKKYPLKKLMEACRRYPLKANRRITFEYVMLGGINDSREDAVRLIKLLKGTRSKVNLIPYNPSYSPTLDKSCGTVKFKKPLEKRVVEFQEILHNARIITIIRKSKGSDISAACGQLKAGYKGRSSGKQ